MKTLLINATLLDSQSAGIYRMTKEMLQSLHDAPLENIRIILVRTRKSDEFPGFRTIVIPNWQLIPGFSAFRLFVILPILAMLNKADYVFEPAHFGPFNLPSKVKRLTMIHDLTPLTMPEYHRSVSAKLQQMFLPRILKKADAIVCISESVKDSIIELNTELTGKVKVLPVGPSRYLLEDPQLELIQKTGVQLPYILTIGTIEPRKNLNFLLDVYQQLRDQNILNHQLVIAGGKGWKSGSFYKRYEGHPYKNDIVLTGYVSEQAVNSLTHHADIFISCSHYEGFGIAAFESMLSGIPTVLPKHSAYTETGKDIAYYYEPDHIDSCIKAFKSIGGKARSSFDTPTPKYYNWNNFVTTFQGLLRSLD